MQPDESARPTLSPGPAIRIALPTVPTSEPTSEAIGPVPPSVAAEPTQLPTRTPTAPSPEPSVAPTEPAAPAFIQHAVQPGDTLLGVALEYGVSMAAIQLANGMGNSINLVAGQTLSVPGSTQWLGEDRFWSVHVVQSGETLVGVADTYHVSVDDILRVNAVADPDMIHVKQQLVIPLSQLVTLARQQPTATAVPAVAIAAATDATTTAPPDQSDTVPDVVVGTDATSTPETAPAPAPPAGPADWSGYILARINQVRAEHGLNILNLVPELTAAAQAHAQDCASRGWGSHVGSDGAVLKIRLERAGYFGRSQGENWVQARNAERAFDWWYGEIPPNDPHRRNILSPYHTEIGIGIAQTNNGYIFITDFGRR